MEPAFETLDQIHCGDAAEVATKLPSYVADGIVTSPPYFRQRDYQEATQLGSEPTPDEYVRRLVHVFRECRRVLKPTGTAGGVLGD